MFYRKKLGILGGGQLGKMLIQSASRYNLFSSVLDSNTDVPAKHLCNDFVQGDINEYDSVYNFGKNVDIITTEIDQVNADALLALEKEGKEVFPQPRILKLIQDKGEQKTFFKSVGIPTSEFKMYDSPEDIKNHKPPFVQKLLKFGYDGRGVAVIKSEDDLNKVLDGPSLVEDFVSIKKELSVIVARNAQGEVKAFPPVEMVTDENANLVDYLFSPAKIDENLVSKCDELAKKIIDELKLVGILAIEMFLTEKNEILVNEISARPHNTGHHTIEANVTSQFDQHLRCILGLPLGDTRLTSSAVMINLLGDSNSSGPPVYSNLDSIFKTEKAYLHLYGKKMSKPYRKMGHVTVIDNELDNAIEKAKIIREKVKVTV